MLISNAPETKAMSDDMCVLIRHFFFSLYAYMQAL